MQASFSAMAKHYDNLHLGNVTEEELRLDEDRLCLYEKRICDGWLLYSLLGIMSINEITS